MIFSVPILSGFPARKCWGNILLTFIAQKPNWSSNWMVRSTTKMKQKKGMLNEQLFWKVMG